MTDAVQLALIAAIAPTLVAGAGLLVSIVNSLKANNIIGATKEIHTLTNSNLAKVTANLELALNEIKGLREQIGQKDRAKDVADALATKGKTDEVIVVNKPANPVPITPAKPKPTKKAPRK